jgi:hypothetical protein
MIEVCEEKYLKAFEAGLKHARDWVKDNDIYLIRVRHDEKNIFVRYKCNKCGKIKEKIWEYYHGINAYVYNDTACEY